MTAGESSRCLFCFVCFALKPLSNHHDPPVKAFTAAGMSMVTKGNQRATVLAHAHAVYMAVMKRFQIRQHSRLEAAAASIKS